VLLGLLSSARNGLSVYKWRSTTLMVLKLFYIFHERIPSVVELETHHVCVQLIIVNKVGMVRKAYARIVIDHVINSEAESLEFQLVAYVNQNYNFSFCYRP